MMKNKYLILVVTTLFFSGCDSQLKFNKESSSELVAAVNEGDTELAEKLLKDGANPDSLSSSEPKISVLNKSIEMNNTRMVKLLLDFNASTEKIGQNSFSPLCWLASTGSDPKDKIEILNLLIKKGSEINKECFLGNTFLHNLMDGGIENLDVIKKAVDLGADPNIENDNGATAISLAIENNISEDVIDYIKKGRQSNVSNPKAEEETVALVNESMSKNSDENKQGDKILIEEFIRSQMMEPENDEFPRGQYHVDIHYTDINNDGITDVVADYSIEGDGGSNLSTSYLAVFERNENTLKPITNIETGNTSGLWRVVTETIFKNNHIELKTLSYGSDDSRCCPSIKGQVFYVLKNGQLQEQKSLENGKTQNLPDQNKLEIKKSGIDISGLLNGTEDACKLTTDLQVFFDGLDNNSLKMNESLKNAIVNVKSNKMGSVNDGGEYTSYDIQTKGYYHGVPVSMINHYRGINNGIYGWTITIDLPKVDLQHKMKEARVSFKNEVNESTGSNIGAIFNEIDKGKTQIICDLSN